jgi:hypothetical protein
MTYRAVGAGPGPVQKYKVDAPWPWGDNTEIALPVDALVSDAWTAAQPKLTALENQLVEDMENEATLFVPKLVKQVMDDTIMPEFKSEMEVAFAELDLMKVDALKTLVAVGATIAVAVGLAAWWVKKG